MVQRARVQYVADRLFTWRVGVAFLTCGLSACGLPPGDGPPLEGGCADAPILESLPEMPAFAVVLSDFASTAIALLDERGATIAERWVDSGTQAPGLVSTLSGDVTFPTRQRADGSMTLIDRFRSDVVTRFCLPAGQLAGQGRTHRVDAPTGYSSNPYDIVWDPSGTAWASRFGANLSAGADPLDQGTDLYALDGESMSPLGQRIDLSEFSAPATLGAASSGATPATALARPSRMVRVGTGTLVGLARLSSDFRSAAPGMVAWVDLFAGTVRGVSLEGMVDCGVVVPVPGRGDAAIVVCNGFPNPAEGPESRRGSAGMVQLGFTDDGTATIEATWRPDLNTDEPLAVYQPISIGDGLVVASGWGDPRLSLVNLREHTVQTIASASEPWVFGTPSWDPSSELLMVPDAEQGVRRFDRVGDVFQERAVNPVGMSLRLPPRHVGTL